MPSKTELIPIALVDDDAEYASAQKRMALGHGFELSWFQTWEEAKERVRDRQFKAVILDAKGQLNQNSAKEDSAHLQQARMDLANWRGSNIHVPYVINTGFDDGETRHLPDEKRYLKGNEADLYGELKVMVERSAENALRHRYEDVFAALQAAQFEPEAPNVLLEVLLFIERGDRSGQDRLFMNPLRQVVEHFFVAAHRCGLLPDELVRPSLNQRLCSLFLAGEKVQFPSPTNPKLLLRSDRPLLPKLLAEGLRNVLRVTNWGSHAMFRTATIEDTNEIQENEAALRAHGGSPYLLSTVVFQLMDVLVFFHRFITENPDPKVNRSWLHVDRVGGGMAPGTTETKSVSRAPVRKRTDKLFAHADDCFITSELIQQYALVDGDMISGEAKRVVVSGQEKWEFITIIKH